MNTKYIPLFLSDQVLAEHPNPLEYKHVRNCVCIRRTKQPASQYHRPLNCRVIGFLYPLPDSHVAVQANPFHWAPLNDIEH